MKTDELTITGLLFSGIVLAGMYFNSQYKINKQMTELQSNYTQAMPLADELIISHMNWKGEADTFFPIIGPEWQAISEEQVEDSINFKIVKYKRRI